MEAENKQRNEAEIQDVEAYESLGFTVKKRGIPDSFKVGRDAQLQLSKIERDLFTDLEDKESGKYIISGLDKEIVVEKKITELDLTAFLFAVGKILYNQSYQSGNEEYNTGLSKTKADRVSKQLDKDVYCGDIVISLGDLCREAFGVDSPDFKQKKAMSTIIDTLHNNQVNIKFPNGDILESYLCTKINTYTRKEDGAKLYQLHLNPIFCNNVKSNYGILPQDIIKRLSSATKKKSAADYKLIRLLTNQDKRQPFTRTLEELLNELNLMEAYKKERGRTEKQLMAIFEHMKSIGLVKEYEIDWITIRSKRAIQKVTFNLSSVQELLKENGDTIPPKNEKLG